MKVTEKIKNILFDLGGVLVDLDRDRVVAAFTELGFPQVDELLYSYNQKGIFHDLEKGTITPEELYTYINRATGREIPPQAMDDTLNKFIIDIPDYKLDMLLALRKRFKVFLLSNISVIMTPEVEAKFFTKQGLTINDYFDRIFYSYEMKLVKPDPEIYLRLLAETGIQAGQTLFIDDSRVNLESARSLGFHTYLAQPREDYRHIFEEL